MADVDFELRPTVSGVERKVWDSEFLEPHQSGRHVLVFSLAAQDFAISADFIEQIIEFPVTVGVPSSGPTLVGLAGISGQPVPVADITPLLGLTSPGLAGFKHGLLLNHKGIKVMLAIESVVVLKELPASDDKTLPAEYRSYGFVARVCSLLPGEGFSDSAVGNSAQVQSTARQVAVLDVPQLLTEVQSAAIPGPTS